jgi:hypothetical protein
MLNDVKIPPMMKDSPDLPAASPPTSPGVPVQPLPLTPEPLKPAPHSVPHPNQTIHTDRQEPGTHHARYFGDKPITDAAYAMPLEDRGSTFSVGLTVAALAVVIAVVVCVYAALR